MHVVYVDGLSPDTRYWYRVVSESGVAGSNGTSSVFTFKTMSVAVSDKTHSSRPIRMAVFGDLGDFNGQSRPYLIDLLNSKTNETTDGLNYFDQLWHVGDFAYDFNSGEGKNGDAYMRDMEPLYAQIPTQTLPGNHEGGQNFNHYTSRFQNQNLDANANALAAGLSSNSKTKSYPDNAHLPIDFPQFVNKKSKNGVAVKDHIYRNNWWYSFEVPHAKVIFLNTEMLVSNNSCGSMQTDSENESRPSSSWCPILRAEQYKFIIRELSKEAAWRAAQKKANPTDTLAGQRWLIVGGHRPMHCSNDSGGDCEPDAARIRWGSLDPPEMLRSQGVQLDEDEVRAMDAEFSDFYGVDIDRLFYEFGVDLFLAGHCHSYERMFDIEPQIPKDIKNPVERKNKALHTYGLTEKKTVNPRGTTHIVTGAPGNFERHDPFLSTPNTFTALRSNTYGYSELILYNATHLNWRQIQTDASRPSTEMGLVIDEVFIFQERHGNFSEARLRDAVGQPQHQPAVTPRKPIASDELETLLRSSDDGVTLDVTRLGGDQAIHSDNNSALHGKCTRN